MAEKIYIIRELNVVEHTDLIAPTTIWACVEGDDVYAETGTKLAGPIPLLFADRVIEGMSTLLRKLGYEVVVETTADD